MEAKIPNHVKSFINEHVHSIAQLDVLVTLRNDPRIAWTPEQVANRLYLPPQTTHELLIDLVHRGFVTQRDGGFRYEPADDSVHGAIDQLAELYQQRRVAVIAEIFAKPSGSAPPTLGAPDSRRKD
jgi:DNA-binding IclR family transcriptional regulator